MIGFALALAACISAALPAGLFLRNLRLYRLPPAPDPDAPPPQVSILIPARNEEASIAAAVEAACASRGVTLEVVVLDDHSTDRTAEIVAELARRDERVRLAAAPPLPPGWCGKQHACAVLAGLARYELLLFLDADVRLAPDGAARAAAFLAASGADLVSGVPRQETGTFGERLLIPLIHFVLLGFLPLGRMRSSRDPAYGAGCGQFFLVRRDGYERSGGHARLRASLHDGLQLPRAFRAAGLATDLCDLTDAAVCRMYRSSGQTLRGLAKNAVEGLAAPGLIVPATLLLGAGQVLPAALVTLGACGVLSPAATAMAAAALGLAYLPRLAAAVRFRQAWLGAALHPLGVAVFLAVQWWALGRKLLGRPAAWKGRAYPAA